MGERSIVTIRRERRPSWCRSCRSAIAACGRANGEWNTLDLICFNGDSIHVVNGKIVMRLHHAERLDGAKPEPLVVGQISLQTEGAEVYYRNIGIQPITAVPAECAEQ